MIGKVEIGNNVKIGAGCIVTTDIPDNTTVVMEKPRVLIRDWKDTRASEVCK